MFLLSILISNLALALAPSASSTATTTIPFFKSPQSLFASGQASRSQLEKNLIKEETDPSYQVEWDKKLFHFKSNELLKEQDLLTSKDPSEKGIAFIFADTFLKNEKSSTSSILTTIPARTKISEFTFDGDWIQLKYKNFTGFILSHEVFLRADFAEWGFHKKLGWVRIQHRENNILRTYDQLQFQLADFTSFVPDPHRAYSLTHFEQGPQIRSKLKIKSRAAEIWALSQLLGHGQVWWKKTEPMKLLDDTPAFGQQILTENLLKKEIFSIAFLKQKKIHGLISANGVYSSTDGSYWKKLDFFGNDNLPVAIHPNGDWYVGSFRSTNEGQSFEPYIRWDRFTQVISDRLKRSPIYLKILKIEVLKNNHLKLLVETGIKRLSVETAVDYQQWKVSQ